MKYQQLAEPWQNDLRCTGSTEQLAAVRRMSVREGAGSGLQLIEVKNGAGLHAWFNESHALDLLELTIDGINIGFMTKNGLQQGRALALPGDYARLWSGGMLATCGLRNTGPANTDDGGEYHPQHGTILHAAAEEVSAWIDQPNREILIRGLIRESALFGPHLRLERTIRVPLDSAKITWEDRLCNLSAEPEPVFLLYHFNFGWPFLSPELQLTFPPAEVIPRNGDAIRGLAEHSMITPPSDGEPEQVFFHYLLPGTTSVPASVRLHHPGYGLSAVLRYDPEILPVLTQWKSMKSGDYALGIEPGTSQLRGRAAEIADGRSLSLPAFSSFSVPLSLTFTREGRHAKR